MAPVSDVTYERRQQPNKRQVHRGVPIVVGRVTEQKVAVIRYHRALLYAALLLQAEQQEDLQRVHELGYEPAEGLF